MREIGHAFFEESDTWAAKVDRFEPDGSFYLFASDTVRGFEVYRFDASASEQASQGTWHLGLSYRGVVGGALRPYCLVRPAA